MLRRAAEGEVYLQVLAVGCDRLGLIDWIAHDMRDDLVAKQEQRVAGESKMACDNQAQEKQ